MKNPIEMSPEELADILSHGVMAIAVLCLFAGIVTGACIVGLLWTVIG